MLNFVPMVIFPPLLQELKGYPQSIIGLILGIRGIGTFLGFAIIAITGRVDPRIIIFFGFGIQAISGFYMSTFDINVSFTYIAWASLVQGLGVGLTWPPISVICFATLSNKFFGEATAMFHLIRNIGSSFFISVSVAVVLHMGQVNFAEIGSMVSLWNQGVNFNDLPYVLNDLNILKLNNELNRQSLMIGYIDAFRLYFWVGLFSIPLIFLIKIKK